MELHKPDHPGSGPDDSDARVGASIVLNRILSDPPVVVISICGDVDQKDMKLLSSLAEPVTVSGYNRIVFDLHETGWFPDQGIGAFVPFLKLAKQQSGALWRQPRDERQDRVGGLRTVIPFIRNETQGDRLFPQQRRP